MILASVIYIGHYKINFEAGRSYGVHRDWVAGSESIRICLSVRVMTAYSKLGTLERVAETKIIMASLYVVVVADYSCVIRLVASSGLTTGAVQVSIAKFCTIAPLEVWNERPSIAAGVT